MCAELGRKVQAVSGSEAQVGVQGSKIGGSPQLPGWWGRVSGHRNAGKVERTDETSRGKSERDGRFRSRRIRFWVVGDSFLWSSDSGFPQSNQQVTVASTRPTLKGPASRADRCHRGRVHAGLRGPVRGLAWLRRWSQEKEARLTGADGGGASVSAGERRYTLSPSWECPRTPMEAAGSLGTGRRRLLRLSPQPLKYSPPQGGGLRAVAGGPLRGSPAPWAARPPPPPPPGARGSGGGGRRVANWRDGADGLDWRMLARVGSGG